LLQAIPNRIPFLSKTSRLAFFALTLLVKQMFITVAYAALPVVHISQESFRQTLLWSHRWCSGQKMHYELIAGSEICTQAPQNTVRYHFTTSAIAASEAQVSSMIKQTSTAKCRSTSSAWRGAPPGCCSLVLPPKD